MCCVQEDWRSQTNLEGSMCDYCEVTVTEASEIIKRRHREIGLSEAGKVKDLFPRPQNTWLQTRLKMKLLKDDERGAAFLHPIVGIAIAGAIAFGITFVYENWWLWLAQMRLMERCMADFL